MKTKMNAHQSQAYRLMDEIVCDVIGGYENTMSDYEEGSEEYVEAQEFLDTPHDELKSIIYDLIINTAETQGYSKHIKFAGKDFILDLIEKRLLKWGY